MDRERVREWYNGYSWLGMEKVYNPYDVLLFLRRREFAAHWFETGTPAFLVDKLFERRVSTVALDDMVGTAELLSTFDVDQIGTAALLFQTGYLTITAEERLGGEALYLFEFKVAEMAPPGSALAQLRERRYADKYRAAGDPIHLIGVEFSRASRNITAFETTDA